MEDTIAAISTTTGVGAISIIRLSGEEALKITNKVFTKDLTTAASHTIHYGYIKDGNEKIDEVLVSVMLAPKTFTREDVVGKSREENVVLTRCLVVEQMVHAGFTISTIAFILNRTVQATRHLLKMSNDYYESSRAFRLATSEATLLNKDVEPIFV